MSDTFSGFPREAFAFWKGLAKNNHREWFQAHKDVYERAVRQPMQALIAELAPLYGPGRLSRINKDMRFARDKPYKNYLATSVGGSYISFSKDGLWVGTGMYKPEPAALRKLREAIADETSGRALTKLIASLRRRGFELDTHERLATVPRGFPPEHARADLLRMKDIYVGKVFGPADASTAEVLDGVVRAIRDLEPFRGWLRQYAPGTSRR